VTRPRIANCNKAANAGTSGARGGFSLAEVLAALTIGAMVSVAVLGIYRRADRSAAAVIQRLDSVRLPNEILQRIAEDLDALVTSNPTAKVTIENKFVNVAGSKLLCAARLTITDTIEDNRNRELKFREVIWQSSYDVASPADNLILYRSHSGITLEDKVLEKNKEAWEREIFVPICSGVTFFRIEAITGTMRAERWSSASPPGIAVTISFAEPYKKVDGTFDVPDEEKITRTIALDRTRKIRFEIAETPEGNGQEAGKSPESPDANNITPVDIKKTEKAGKSTK